MSHKSNWTGLDCKREELTGKPCDGKGHVSVADDLPDRKATADSRKED